MNKIVVYGTDDLLLVDDDPQFHTVFEFIYKRQKSVKNKLIHLMSGEECLEYLVRQNGLDANCPGLILMDINMPGMSGIQTLESIRIDMGLKHIPVVIMLSSSSYQGDIDRSLNAGANDYIEKPFDINGLSIVAA